MTSLYSLRDSVATASDYRSLISLAQSALDALPAAVYVCDRDGVVVRFNRRASEFWGRTPRAGDTAERFCGSFRLYAFDGRVVDQTETPMATVLRTGEQSSTAEVVVERPDGTRIVALATVEALRDANGEVEGGIGCLQDITARKETEDRLRESEENAEARQRRLINELNHRVKNSLASAQAIVRHTLSRADALEAARDAIDHRLSALARAHDLLSRESWRSADIGDIARSALSFRCGDDTRFTIEGPPVRLTPKIALAFAIALHELSGNARKYGALCVDSGRIAVTWRVAGTEEAPRLRLDWRESGGPPVVEPVYKGFGSLMLEWGLPNELNGEATLRFPAAGVTCRIDVPLAPLS